MNSKLVSSRYITLHHVNVVSIYGFIRTVSLLERCIMHVVDLNLRLVDNSC